MTSFFSSSSPLDKKIEAVTSESYAEPPLEMYLTIADEISATNDGGAGYLKAIKKRLQSKVPHVQFLTVNLLDICVKNGKDAFHETVANRDFLEFFANFATTNKYPHISDCALSMIQQWAKAFPAAGLTSYAEIYQKMKNRGVPFPDQSITGNVSVLTPPVNLTVVAQRKHSSSRPDRSPVPRSPNRSPNPRNPPAERHPLSWVSPEYSTKIHVESEQVLSFLTLFIDMIAASTGVADLKTNESIIGLHSTILDCRGRVSHLLIELIDYEQTEQLMELLLAMNDLIRDTVDYYQAKLAGMDIPPPQIVKPKQLGGQQQGEAEQKERPEEHKSNQTTSKPIGEPDFNQSLQNLTINPASQPIQSSPPKSSNPLDEFDPLA